MHLWSISPLPEELGPGSPAGQGEGTQGTGVEILRKVQTVAGTMAQGMQIPANYVCRDSPPHAQGRYIMQRASRLVA